jgi:hypothetical protein
MQLVLLAVVKTMGSSRACALLLAAVAAVHQNTLEKKNEGNGEQTRAL